MPAPEPISSAYQEILDIILDELPEGNKHVQIATRIVALLDERKLCRVVADAELTATIQNEYSDAVLICVSDVPEVSNLVFKEATVANVTKLETVKQWETAMLALKDALEAASGQPIPLDELPLNILELYTKNPYSG